MVSMKYITPVIIYHEIYLLLQTHNILSFSSFTYMQSCNWSKHSQTFGYQVDPGFPNLALGVLGRCADANMLNTWMYITNEEQTLVLLKNKIKKRG